MNREVEVKSQEDQQTDQQAEHHTSKERTGVLSRRSFLQGLAVAGAAMAFFPTGITRAQFRSFEAADLSDEQLLSMFDSMLDIRWFERTFADMAIRGETRGTSSHFYAGQEAVAVGVSTALRQDDYVLSTHRADGHALAKGVDMARLAAEGLKKATGLNNGYGNSMHYSDPSVGFLGADGIVGPGASFGAGVAYALKARGTDQVALTYGGDGHYATPHFHMALNEAALAQLPFIYMIENNQYLQYTHYRWTTVLDDIASAAQQYRIPGVVVDGQDVLAVYNTVKAAVDRARNGGGPTLIEAKTYRYYNHSGPPGATEGELGAFGPDPLLINVERPEREIRTWLARDPINLFKNVLIEFDLLDQEGAEQREALAQERVQEAFQFAIDSPPPNPEDGLNNVFAGVRVPAWQIVDN